MISKNITTKISKKISISISDKSTSPLIDNGDFSNGLTSWTAFRDASGDTTGGYLTVTNGSSTSGGFDQPITTEIGETYSLSLDVLNSSLANVFVRVYTEHGTTGTQVLNQAPTPNASHSYEFVAVSTTSYIVLQNFGGSPGDYSEFDNVVVEKVS